MTARPGDAERRIRELLERRGLPAPRDPAGVVPRGRDRGPLAPGQRRLWLLDRMHPGGTDYLVPLAWRLDGALDEPALVHALREVFRRHDALRTVFRVRDDGEPEQCVLPDLPEITVEDLGGLPAGERERAERAALRAETERPFDLAAGPVARARLLRLDERRWTLVLVVHHIVFDEWSAGVLTRDLSALYAAAHRGEAGPAAASGPRYLDWVLWDAERSAAADGQVDHWRRVLDGAPTTVDLPTDAPGGGEGGGPGGPAGELRVPVPPGVVADLTDLGRAEGCTPFMTLLAAWAAFLHRLSGQSDLVIGAPVARRGPAETHAMVGFFLNTVALRPDLGGDPGFRALLARTRAVTTDAYAHADAPFDAVVEALRPERSGARHPLFRAWFADDDAGGPELDLPGLRSAPVPLTTRTAKFDLALFLTRHADGAALILEYDGALFTEDTAARLADRLARLLAALAERPDAPLSAHELLDPAERERLVRTWNDTARDLGAEARAHHWFEKQAARTPDAVAVEFAGQRVTYAELDARAEAVARALRRVGVTDGTYVALAVRRSVAMLAAVLGTLKAGGAYVALDPDHPRDRLALVLADTGAPVLLVDPATRDGVPDTDAVLLDVTALPDPGPAASGPAAPAAPRGLPHDPVAYVTYTSGSTGRPKGILMPHRAVSNLVAWTLERYGPWEPGHRTLQFASLSFDVSFQEIFSTLGSGGTLVLVTEEQRRDVHGLAELLRRERVERLYVPAAALQQLAEGHRGGATPPTALRTVVAGSEQLVVTDDLRRLFADLPGTRLHNEYGPSETHVVTAHALPADPAAWPEWVPVGRPVANTRVYVLDALGRPVPVGVRGEVHLGGRGLAHGYLGMPRQTAAAFTPDPFGPEPGARLYRTGDIARHLSDGTLEFLGRADDQVKIRGYRVELDEVRTTVDAHPAVRSAFVRVHGERSAERRLVAYVVPHAGEPPAAGELAEFVRRRLPGYMVPSAFVTVERLPLTVNGKVDQRRLPEPDFAATVRAEGRYAPPRDALERAVAEVLADALSVPRVGRDDDFFALGGHSLLAAKALWAVQERQGVTLTLGDFFRRPTAAGLAACVRRARESGAPPPQSAAAAERPSGGRRLDDLFDDLLGPAQ
ncbi:MULTISPECIES: non-ribosomal peptide synthetase [Streptomyces]|uniref:non-ribosomal peptide synthetase n=1 Tax=Streptomyces TaxID=1883 RepID=UPI002249015F|nr:amino acid adenylation domain-containing protein [Streptomyces sp. JHD 1]MCX2969319.1 amino acid adenylation domain-containing protein [Streptomyces sp. JHD 1]